MAVTLHNRWFDAARWHAEASAAGLVLLSGIERTIDGKHLLEQGSDESRLVVGGDDDRKRGHDDQRLAR